MKKEIHRALDFVLFLSILGTFIIFLSSSSQMSSNKVSVTRLFKSWSKPLLLSVTKSTYSSCRDLNQTLLFNYEWPGTANGCDCTVSSYRMKAKYAGNVYSGSCERNQTKAGCQDINEIEKVKTQKWRGSLMCHENDLKESPDTYFQLYKVSDHETCTSSHKPCGIIDTLGNKLCVPKESDCPLTNLNIFGSRRLSNDSSNENEHSTLKHFVISEVRVSDQNHTCNDANIDLFSDDYVLLNSHSRSGCRESIDKRFKVLDYYSKRSFYDDNGITPLLVNLPKYPLLHNSFTYLHGGVYVGWRDICPLKNIPTLQGEINDSLNAFSSSNTYILVSVILLVIVFIGGVTFYKYSNLDENNVARDGHMRYFLVIYTVLGILNYAVYKLSQNIIDTITSSNGSVFFKTIGSKECSDSLTNEGLKAFSKFYFSNVDRFNQLKLLSGLSILICIGMKVFVYLSKVGQISAQNLVHPKNDQNNNQNQGGPTFVRNDHRD